MLLDPEFDEVVKGDDYRVFQTVIGDCGGLYVSRKGPHRFVVQSRAGASADGTFDDRVVTRRLDDVGKRLERIDLPVIPPEKHVCHDTLRRPADPKKPDSIP